MGDLIKAIIVFFANKGLHLGYKLSIALLALLTLFFLNDISGFSRQYFANSALDQIVKLKQIDPDILEHDTLVNKKYFRLKSNIINDESQTAEFIKGTKSFINWLSNPSRNHGASSYWGPETDWLEWSTLLFFYFTIIVMFFTVFPAVLEKGRTFKEKIMLLATYVSTVGLIYFIGKCYKYIISIVPLINRYEWVNYSIYAILPFLIAGAWALWTVKTDKKRRLAK